MQRTTPIKIAVIAVSVFLLSLMTLSCSAPSGGSTEPTVIPTALSTPTQVSAQQPNSNGGMERANVHGTGVYVTEGVRQLTGIRWSFKPQDQSRQTAPVVHNSIIYFGQSGHLYAVDAATGIEKWNYRVHNLGTSTPAVAADTVYIGGWEELFALSAETGQVKWVFRPDREFEESYFHDPVVDGGTVYFGSSKHFYALDSETGQEKWKVRLVGTTSSIPAVYDGTVFIGTFSPDINQAGYLYALDSKTGQENWKFQAAGGGIAGAVAVTDGVVYVSTEGYGLFALASKDGQEKWRHKKGTGLLRGPAVAYGTAYVTDPEGLYAIDAETGKEKWKLQAEGDLYSNPVIADGVIYFGRSVGNIGVLFGGESDGYLHAVDAQSGQELWNLHVAGITSRDPAVSEGTVYFGSGEGSLYAVK